MCDIMLECFKDISIPLREMKRVCKAGGIVVAIEPFYQSFCEYYPEEDDVTRDLLLKHSRADRDFGVGPMLPSLLNDVGLLDIDLISWFWGRIGYKFLDYETIDERIESMEENFKSIRVHIVNSKQLTINEQNKVVEFYETKLNKFKQNPLNINQDMSVSGLPVFIVKGIKTDDNIFK